MAYSVSAVGLRDTFPRFNKIVLQVGLQTLNNLRRCHSSDTTLTHELSLSLSLSVSVAAMAPSLSSLHSELHLILVKLLYVLY